MSFPIFLDANIPIYAAGRPHPLKEPASRILALAAEHPQLFVSDAEVAQELLHRYLALRIWDQGRLVLQHFLALMDGRLESILVSDVEDAMSLAGGHHDVSAGDLLHVAVMQRIGASRIVTADADYDRVRGIERLDPAQLSSWEQVLLA